MSGRALQLGGRLRKWFTPPDAPPGWFEGTVMSAHWIACKRRVKYRVEYDDGDAEEYYSDDEHELHKIPAAQPAAAAAGGARSGLAAPVPAPQRKWKAERGGAAAAVPAVASGTPRRVRSAAAAELGAVTPGEKEPPPKKPKKEAAAAAAPAPPAAHDVVPAAPAAAPPAPPAPAAARQHAPAAPAAGAPGGAAQQLHVSELSVAALPPPRGPACVNWSQALLATPRDAQGVCPLTLERVLRCMHYRGCLAARRPHLPADAVQAATADGAPYRHVDAPVRRDGAALRAVLLPLFRQRGGGEAAAAAAAKEALACCLRGALLSVAVGRPATFVEWRAEAPPPGSGAGGAHPPTSDADLDSFAEYLRARQREKHSKQLDHEAVRPFFGFAYQTRGFERTATLVAALSAASRAKAAQLRACDTWHDALQLLMTFPEVGSFFAGQALCIIYHGVALGDAPGGPFRAQLLPRLQPHSLMSFALLTGEPVGVLDALFPGVAGKQEEKIAWLAAHAHELLTWAGLSSGDGGFPWEPAGAGLDGAAFSAGCAPRGCRPMTAVDMEYSLCWYHRSAAARDALRGGAAHLAAALGACGGARLRLPFLQDWKRGPADVAVHLTALLQQLQQGGTTAAGAKKAKAPPPPCGDDDLAALAKAVRDAAAAVAAAGGDPAAAVSAAFGDDRVVLPTAPPAGGAAHGAAAAPAAM